MIFAYIDAGTGAMLLQWIIAFFVGASIFFRTAILGFFRRVFGRRGDATKPAQNTKSDDDDPVGE